MKPIPNFKPMGKGLKPITLRELQKIHAYLKAQGMADEAVWKHMYSTVQGLGSRWPAGLYKQWQEVQDAHRVAHDAVDEFAWTLKQIIWEAEDKK